MLSLSPIHWLALVGTLVAVLGVGALLSGRQSGAAAFSLNGRKAGTGLVAGAIMSSAVGGGATIGTAQMAFQYGMVAWCFMLGIGLGLLLLGLFFAKPLRRSGLETVPQFLKLHYGRAAGPVVSLISCCGIFFACAASVLPGLELLRLLFGLTPAAAALLMVGLMAAYVCLGGQKASGVSGMLKSAVLWSALLLCSLWAVNGLTAAPAETAVTTLPAGAYSLLSRGWGYVFSCLGATAMGMMTAQMYIQALYSATDARTARRGALLGAALAVPVGLMSTLIGIYMRARHPETPPLFALPAFLLQEVPAAVGGVALGGIVLSVVSSAAVQALAVGTMAARDVAGDLCGIRNERTLSAVNRAVLLLMAGAVALFCLLHRDASVLSWNYLSMALRGGGIFLPLAAAVLFGHAFTRRISPAWVMASMLLSTAASLTAAAVFNMPPTAVGVGTAALPLLIGYMRGKAKG